MSPVRAHYGGTRQLDTKLVLRATCIEQVPDIVSALREFLITKCALQPCEQACCEHACSASRLAQTALDGVWSRHRAISGPQSTTALK